jgi:hypothetical protein
MAAVLACGEGAVLSHRSAAELWALLPAAKGDVHVTVPGRGGRDKRRDIHLHRSPSLTTTAMTRHKRIAVTPRPDPHRPAPHDRSGAVPQGHT